MILGGHAMMCKRHIKRLQCDSCELRIRTFSRFSQQGLRSGILCVGKNLHCLNGDTKLAKNVVDMKTGAVSAAAGSAYAEFGQTKVIVSVYVSISIPSPPYCFNFI